MKVKAYCWASGEVGFGTKTPEGTICFAEGKEKAFKEKIQVLCRLAYPRFVDGVRQPDTWLIPGIPEAVDQEDAIDALIAFKRLLNKTGVTTL